MSTLPKGIPCHIVGAQGHDGALRAWGHAGKPADLVLCGAHAEALAAQDARPAVALECADCGGSFRLRAIPPFEDVDTAELVCRKCGGWSSLADVKAGLDVGETVDKRDGVWVAVSAP